MSATRIYISIPVVKMTTYSISKAEADLIRRMAITQFGKPGDKVGAIKFIRDQYGLGLKEAKDVCDAVLLAHPNQQEIIGELAC